MWQLDLGGWPELVLEVGVDGLPLGLLDENHETAQPLPHHLERARPPERTPVPPGGKVIPGGRMGTTLVAEVL